LDSALSVGLGRHRRCLAPQRVAGGLSPACHSPMPLH